jgi:hypothetical protein
MRRLASTANTGGSACLEAEIDPPKAQEKILGGRAAIRNALRRTRSTYQEPGDDTLTLDLSARPISF